MPWLAALKADGDAPLTALFGEEHKVKLLDPDPAAAKATRAKIVDVDADAARAEGAERRPPHPRDRRPGLAGAVPAS